MEDVTEELSCAGYTIRDESFEGILYFITILEADEELIRKLFEKAGGFIHAALVILCVPVVLTIMLMVVSAIYLWRFYIQTIKFMDNTVQRIQEMKLVAVILVKKIGAIRAQEKGNLTQPMFSYLYDEPTRL